jgi:aminomethyltransferase
LTLSASNQKTPLYELHKRLGAKIVPFAGYDMPVQYKNGIIKEHLHTRASAGLFDVSHMGQITVKGEGAALALETLVPGDIVGLGRNQQRYSMLTNETGGIIDDLMILNRGSHFHLVVNAACKMADLAYIRKKLSDSFAVDYLENLALLALQGPDSAASLKQFVPECDSIGFMEAMDAEIAGHSCLITRSGYTGEDGYEISMQTENAEEIAQLLLQQPGVEAVGLGARDSLRLEAGLSLFGHDIDEKTSPIEAGLGWAVGKDRRPAGSRSGGFPGADIILRQLAEGVSRRRVGLQPEGRVPVREGAELLSEKGITIGRVTSGGFGPSVNAPIAMGYVDLDYSSLDTRLYALVRGKQLPLKVCKLPFVKHNYYRSK